MRYYEVPSQILNNSSRDKQESLLTSWTNRNPELSTSYLQVSFPAHHSPLQLDICSWQRAAHNRNTKQTLPVISATNVLLLSLPHCDAYGHIYNETLSEVVGVDDNYPEYDCIIITLSPLMIKVLDYFKNLPLSPRIKFVRMGEAYELQAKTIHTLFFYPFMWPEMKKNATKLKSLFESTVPVSKLQKPLLVYCSRNTASTVHNKRRMEENNERAIVACLQKYAANRNLQFVSWRDETKDSDISIARQYELFTNAKLVVGPHGGAFSNCIFLQPDLRPSVVELIEHPFKVFDIMFKGFLSELSDYYVVPFCKASEAFVGVGNWKVVDNTEIDVNELQKTLDIIAQRDE